MDTSILLAIVSLPFFGACGMLLLPEKHYAWCGRLAVITSLVAFALILRCWSAVEDGSIHVRALMSIEHVPLSLAFRADRLGVFFALLITLVGAAISQYARFYFKDEVVPRFWFLFLVFQGSMLGIALAESLLLLFVFWELTTLTSALLIAHHYKLKSARSAASLAFLITAGGGLCLLAGLILLSVIAGTDQFLELSKLGNSLVTQDRHRVVLVLLLLGAFTKSAQFPFHFWLPGAMAAPIPISAYLHSATMVKGGILLLARLFPIFSLSDLWQPILGTVGLVTFIIASWNAFRCSDMKELLAHSTVAYLGVLTAIYGYSAGGSVTGELLHLANHTFYKSSLFLLLGWFEKVAGTRDINLLDREIWYRHQPWGTLLFCLAGMSIVGGPFLLSYTSKDLFFDVVLKGAGDIWPALLVVVGSILTVAFAIKLVVATFWGKVEPEASRVKVAKVSVWLLLIPALLILPQLVGGFMVERWSETLHEPVYKWTGGLAFWSQVDVKSTVKLVIFAGGFLLYFGWRRLARIPLWEGFLPMSLRLGAWFLQAIGRVSSMLQGSNSSKHMALMLVATLAFTLFMLNLQNRTSRVDLTHGGWEETIFFAPPAALVILTSLALPFLRDRVTVLILLGLGTFGVALLYILMRAPDVAMTQLLVDTLGLIVLLVVFYQMRRQDETAPQKRSLLRAGVALIMGLATGGLVFLAAIQAAAERVGHQQLAMAVPHAHGRNVVNVILVDIRGIDTMGEVLVLILAALGVAALLQGYLRHPQGTLSQRGRE